MDMSDQIALATLISITERYKPVNCFWFMPVGSHMGQPAEAGPAIYPRILPSGLPAPAGLWQAVRRFCFAPETAKTIHPKIAANAGTCWRPDGLLKRHIPIGRPKWVSKCWPGPSDWDT